jgi:hypothetical protein
MVQSFLTPIVLTRNSNESEIGRQEIEIANEPDDELFRNRCRRKIDELKKINEDIQQFIDYVQKYEINSTPVGKKKKPCKSLTRARGFCILLMQDSGFLPGSLEKTELMRKTGELFPGQSKQKMYQLLKIDPRLTLADKEKHPEDYAYGLTLFNQKTDK